MKKFGVALCALMLGSVTALAADLPVRTYSNALPLPVAAAYGWSGFYVGGNVGGALGNANFGSYSETLNAVPIYVLPIQSSNIGGGFGGGQIGYNYQIQNVVFGVEADGEWSRISTNSTAADPNYFGLVIKSTNSVNWFGTVRGRIGFAVDRFLVFGTGGYAYENVTNTRSVTYTDNYSSSLSQSSVKSGYVVGAGVEYAFSTNWSAKLEYQYLKFRSDYLYANELLGVFPTAYSGYNSVSNSFSTVRVGLNYKFGGPVVAKY